MLRVGLVCEPGGLGLGFLGGAGVDLDVEGVVVRLVFLYQSE